MSEHPGQLLHVTFVCTGNICRSPMAEKMFADQLRERGLEQRRGFGRVGTGFGGIVTGVELKQDTQAAAPLGRRAIEERQQLETVDTLHPVELRPGEQGLVRLQMTDEFPADRGGAERFFVQALLHAVFADRRQSIPGGVFDRGRRMRLGDRQQFDAGRIPPRLPAGGHDLRAHSIRLSAKSFVSNKH